jgi:hypothetical protein
MTVNGKRRIRTGYVDTKGEVQFNKERSRVKLPGKIVIDMPTSVGDKFLRALETRIVEVTTASTVTPEQTAKQEWPDRDFECGCHLLPVDDEKVPNDLCSEATGMNDGVGWRLVYCPVHAAAPALLAAAVAVRPYLSRYVGGGRAALDAAIAQAKGAA